jgi:hypothetical protein
MGVIIVVLIVGFSVLETFFPVLKLASAPLSLLGKAAIKLAPQTKKFLGLVSDNVMKSLKVTVKGLQNSFDKLKNHPIEQELIQGYPDDHIFTKKEVLSILEEFSLKIESLIKKELEITNDAETRAIVSEVKNEIKTGQNSV